MQIEAEPTSLVSHPLEPLTAAEIEQASAILRKEIAPTARFVYVMLAEPPKADVLAYEPGDPIDRRAFIVIRDREERVAAGRPRPPPYASCRQRQTCPDVAALQASAAPSEGRRIAHAVLLETSRQVVGHAHVQPPALAREDVDVEGAAHRTSAL